MCVCSRARLSIRLEKLEKSILRGVCVCASRLLFYQVVLHFSAFIQVIRSCVVNWVVSTSSKVISRLSSVCVRMCVWCQQKVKLFCEHTRVDCIFHFFTLLLDKLGKKRRNCGQPTAIVYIEVRHIFWIIEKFRRNASAGAQHERLCN